MTCYTPSTFARFGSARKLGDCLIVAVNSDVSARRHKGRSYLIVTEPERSELLLALSCVDHLFVFDDPTVEPPTGDHPASHLLQEHGIHDPHAARATHHADAWYRIRPGGGPRNNSSTQIIRQIVRLHGPKRGRALRGAKR